MLISPPDSLVSISFKNDSFINRSKFKKLINEFGDKILRLKGNINFGNGPEFVEIAGSRLIEKEAKTNLANHTSFTVIAWQISRDEMNEKFNRLMGE